ncbi:hypothetical protein [Microbacterium ureisolvens]|nr:hypothetical protein [Microbacterium ureisolvens]
MLTLLIRALIFLVSAALGLIVADLILEGSTCIGTTGGGSCSPS